MNIFKGIYLEQGLFITICVATLVGVKGIFDILVLYEPDLQLQKMRFGCSDAKRSTMGFIMAIWFPGIYFLR